ncbi:hypothetical protein QYZ88_009200 [Lachnospiraceae bacterium C1.1]|nr:hypothetical protein [Lachnospiraceae bacterium C1.1]
MIEVNESYWPKKKTNNTGKFIIVFHDLPGGFSSNTRENVIARGLQEKYNLPVVTIQYIDNRKECDLLDRSFGFTTIDFNDYMIDETDKILNQEDEKELYKQKRYVFNLMYKGIPYGEALFDHIIRKKRGCSLTWDDVDWNEFMTSKRLALRLIDGAISFFNVYEPEYIIVSEGDYLKAVIIRVAQKYGSKVISLNPDYFNALFMISSDKTWLHDFKFQDMMDDCINEYVSNTNVSDELFLMRGEKKLEIEDNGRLKVFILLHSFADAPRSTTLMYVYDDYVDWFVDTINKIKSIKNVDWFIKDHPMSIFFGQKEFVSEVMEKVEGDNIHICDKDVDGDVIRKIADCVVTCAGDAGIEYWAYGIPTISLARTHYSKHGISYVMKSKDEYYYHLENIEKLAKPSDESIKEAKLRMSAFKRIMASSDSFGSIYCKNRDEEIKRYREGDMYHFDVRYEFTVDYISLLQHDQLKNSSQFLLNKMFEVT